MLHITHEELVPMFDDMVQQVRDRRPTLAADVMRIPTAHYRDPVRWQQEVDQIFRTVPLVVSLSSELPDEGSYRAITLMDTPILLTRSKSGEVRAFLNACRHRGVRVVAEGSGKQARFSCPYHAWTYSSSGDLVGLPEHGTFGAVEKATLGLHALPVEERHGLVWAVLTPGASLDLALWLGDMDELLAKSDLGRFHTFRSDSFDSPNWKVVLEGYLETYHFDALHKNTFAQWVPSNVMAMDKIGRHCWIRTPVRGIETFEPPIDGAWTTKDLLAHSFFVFPNTQFSFVRPPDGPSGAGWILMSQIFPGKQPSHSRTIQRMLAWSDVGVPAMDENALAIADGIMAVVSLEDLPVIETIQNGLAAQPHDSAFVLGRNESGLQHFHDQIFALVPR